MKIALMRGGADAKGDGRASCRSMQLPTGGADTPSADELVAFAAQMLRREACMPCNRVAVATTDFTPLAGHGKGIAGLFGKKAAQQPVRGRLQVSRLLSLCRSLHNWLDFASASQSVDKSVIPGILCAEAKRCSACERAERNQRQAGPAASQHPGAQARHRGRHTAAQRLPRHRSGSPVLWRARGL